MRLFVHETLSMKLRPWDFVHGTLSKGFWSKAIIKRPISILLSRLMDWGFAGLMSLVGGSYCHSFERP